VDNDFSVDLAEIASTIRTHDVIVVRFISVGDRLLLDFRSDGIEGPLVRLVGPVKDVQQRYRELRTMRPRFGDPEKMVSVFWPRFAGSLEATGVWGVVLDRAAASGHPGAVAEAESALTALLARERAHQRAAIAGADGFRTLWSASPAKR